MPECQAKFCTVVRGKGISTFSIPDPKKNYDLCARWIHNLGNAKLNPKSFVHSKEKIVCERHFEKDCFKEDIRAKIMGYTPKRKLLKEDAVPTLFKDSKPKKLRENSSRRIEKKEKQELINRLLETDENSFSAEPPEKSGRTKKTDVPINQRKRKLPGKEKSSKKVKLHEDINRDKNVQASVQTEDKSTSCNIRIEFPNQCPTCVLRNHPMLPMKDHGYFRAPATKRNPPPKIPATKRNPPPKIPATKRDPPLKIRVTEQDPPPNTPATK